MVPFHLLSAAEQVAAHLHTELNRGRWLEHMPGVNPLAKELGVNRKTVEAALQLLEQQGVLVGQGAGRKRRIVLSADDVPPQRVGILLHDGEGDLKDDYIIEVRHELVEAGHTPVIQARSMSDLDWDVKRIARSVGQIDADAWLILAGSRDVLEWFSQQAKPALALFGRREGLPIAGVGPDKRSALKAAARHLAQLGHRRIVLLAREERRLPESGQTEMAFLNQLEVLGIRTGKFNLPDWEGTPGGLQDVLESLFSTTPPTALIVEEATLFTATMQFLAERGVQVPADVSLICTDPSPTFGWCQKSVAHISWDSRPVVLRVARWAKAVATGRADLKQTRTPAKYVSGETVGPAPR